MLFDLGITNAGPLALSFVLVFAFLQFCYTVILKPQRSKLRHLPSPHQGFFLFRLFHEPTVRELEQWLDELPHEGLIRYFGLWNQERIFAASPEAVKGLLVNEAYKFIKPELQHILAANISNEGLLIQEGNVHKAARKHFQPAFHADQIRRAYPIMWETAFDLVNALSVQSQAGGVHPCDTDGEKSFTRRANVCLPINQASIDIIGRWGFSTSFNALKDPLARFARSYTRMFKTTVRGQRTLYAAAIIGPKLALRLPLRAVKTIKGVMAFVNKTADAIVTEHEESFNRSKDSSGTSPLQQDMLSSIMKTGFFTHDDLVTQTVHLLAAATETVSGSIDWAIHLISRHPEVQARLRDEIRQHLPSPCPMTGGWDVKQADFTAMKYLDAVIKETLRFHSVNTILWRECVSPAQILGNTIPVGTKVVFSPWASNRDPKHWGPDARSFNPERWLDDTKEQGGADSIYSFITFGAGPRRCMGDQYARAQMRCLIAGMIGRFEFSPISPEKESDEGQEIGDQAALTLFKTFGSWQLNIRELEGW